METFYSILEKRVEESDSLLCVGLDPHPDGIDEFSAAGVKAFCSRIVKATAPFAAAFKPNAAFFELLGSKGWDVLKEIIDLIHEESSRSEVKIPIILDAKRGDIASTAYAYAQSAFEIIGADAITLNPYLGKDSIDPFLTFPGKGVFLLCKTSNTGASDLQDLRMTDALNSEKQEGVFLYEHVARLGQTWNTSDNIGLVVGATHPEALERTRRMAPDLWFLSPGVGAQGGDLETALRSGLRKDGGGMLINLSRSLAREEDPAKAAASFCDLVRKATQKNANQQALQ
ncbi:MAG TPA: orotidine-5'-phosphate decarboxylase [Anaerolineales bacterium]|nr:orotidine-5'-phosphate decarboxylase [Anaerolineales bacterium]